MSFVEVAVLDKASDIEVRPCMAQGCKMLQSPSLVAQAFDLMEGSTIPNGHGFLTACQNNPVLLDVVSLSKQRSRSQVAEIVKLPNPPNLSGALMQSPTP